MATAIATTGKGTTGTTKERRTYTARLIGEAGDSVEVRVEKRAADWRVVVFYAAGKNGQRQRGATSTHPDLNSALARQREATTFAEKAGWKRVESNGPGYVATPDAFTLEGIPKPKAAPKTATATPKKK